MKKVIILVVIVTLVLLEVFYFQFRTYFVNNIVSEQVPEVMQAQGSVIIKQGNFVDSDFVHRGTGKVKLIKYSDGKRLLSFEDFDITNGPDLFVYLVNTKEPKKDIESLGDYYNLGKLKGNMGNQNYEIPDEVSDFNSVVIWCERFGVLFPYAVLTQNN